ADGFHGLRAGAEVRVVSVGRHEDAVQRVDDARVLRRGLLRVANGAEVGADVAARAVLRSRFRVGAGVAGFGAFAAVACALARGVAAGRFGRAVGGFGAVDGRRGGIDLVASVGKD